MTPLQGWAPQQPQCCFCAPPRHRARRSLPKGVRLQRLSQHPFTSPPGWAKLPLVQAICSPHAFSWEGAEPCREASN